MADVPHVPDPANDPPAATVTRVSPLAADDMVEFTVVLRSNPGGAVLSDHVAKLRAQVPEVRRHLSYTEFEDIYGPDPNDIDALGRFASAHNLEIGESNAIAGTVQVRGRAADINAAFGVEMATYVERAGDGTEVVFRGHERGPRIPRDLGGIVEGVTGLSTRPFARPHFVVGPQNIRPLPGAPSPTPAAASQGFTATDIGATYGVPKTATARGQTVAIIELGGGYVAADMDHYCTALGIPLPKITDVSVDGARNAPTGKGDPGTADGEVLLDMQVVAAVARSANQRVYFARNTEQSFINAISAAVRDGCTSISISWGAPEAHWTRAGMAAFDRACQAAIAMGIPVFAAAGDDGSTDGLRNGRSNADFPASSPNVVACGGTRLPDLDRTRETAWNDMPKGGATGGAVSDVFPTPGYQQQVPLPASVNDGKTRRTIPDVSAVAAPSTGYRIYIGGNWYVFGGTSAVSPLMASMAAILTHRMQLRNPGQKIGDFNALLYRDFRTGGGVREINDGSNNGQYKTAPIFSAVLGLGTPNFDKMLQIAIRGARGPAAPDATPPRRGPATPGDGLAA